MPGASEPTLSAAGRLPQPGAVREVARLFLKLGTIAFGGPAAHIAMMEEEVVRRLRWLDRHQFLDLLGATYLIPGPNSTEMAIHIGYARAGWRGLITAGVCFILPAMAIVLSLAWAYTRYGALPEVSGVLYGVKPVIIAVILQALWGLAKTAVKGPLLAGVGGAVLALALSGANEVVLLFSAALLVMALQNAKGKWGRAPSALLVLPVTGGKPAAAVALGTFATTPSAFLKLFLVFLKVGSILFGSGYVLLAFLHADLVVRLRWLTDRQLLDAIAVGQVTPGPVFTTATFVGYLLGGWWGALVATVGIFLPSFVFVAATHPFIPRLRRSPWASGFLDGANVASLGLMAAVTLQLGRAALVDEATILLALASAVLLFRFRVNSAWLVLAGALFGLLSRWI